MLRIGLHVCCTSHWLAVPLKSHHNLRTGCDGGRRVCGVEMWVTMLLCPLQPFRERQEECLGHKRCSGIEAGRQYLSCPCCLDPFHARKMKILCTNIIHDAPWGPCLSRMVVHGQCFFRSSKRTANSRLKLQEHRMKDKDTGLHRIHRRNLHR